MNWAAVDAVAHFLYCPGMFGRRFARARWYHEIHLIPGSWLDWVCRHCWDHEQVDHAPDLLEARKAELRGRLAELRQKADERRQHCPDYPDSPEQVAERRAEAPGWAALQAQTSTWQEDRRDR